MNAVKEFIKSTGSFFFFALSGQPFMLAMRNAFIVAMPVLLVGSAALLINNLPLDGYQSMMTALFGPDWKRYGGWLWNATFGVLSLIICYSVSHSLTERHNSQHPMNPVNPLIVAMVSFCCLALFTQPALSLGSEFPARWMGVSGLFVATSTSILATSVMLFLCGVKSITLRLYAEEADQVTPQTFEALLPSLITVFLFAFVKLALALNGIDSLHSLMHDSLQYIFSGIHSELLGALVFVVVCQVAWFFGIHGPNLLDSVTHSIYGTAAAANLAAFEAGAPLPHVATKSFFDVFVYLGGSGATIGLIIAIFLLSRDGGNRRVAYFSILPGIFNINEIVIFGLPIIINPVFLIPFLLAPILMMLLSYAAVASGLVPHPIHQVDWTAPALISGWMSCKSVSAVLLQLVNIAVSAAVYAPFVRLSDRVKKERFAKAFSELFEVACGGATGPQGRKCIDRGGAVGLLARGLVNDLEAALRSSGQLYLEYQPQVSLETGRAIGAEALLRWNHPVYGLLPPPIAVAVAEDAGLMENLGLKVLREACAERRRWQDQGLDDYVTVSVNLSVKQLEKPNLTAKVRNCLASYRLDPRHLELEVTESLALDPNSRYLGTLKELHNLGVRLAMDDFGMGHSSLLYIRHFPVSTLKVDAALSRDVARDQACREMVSSIEEFCRNLSIATIIEHVENKEQLDALLALRCRTFQGFYFSLPVSGEACLQFLKNYRAPVVEGSGPI